MLYSTTNRYSVRLLATFWEIFTCLHKVSNYYLTVPQDYLLSRDSASSSSDMGVCAPYLQVGVAAVMEWDTPTRERVLFEGLVLTSKTDGEITTLC